MNPRNVPTVEEMNAMPRHVMVFTQDQGKARGIHTFAAQYFSQEAMTSQTLAIGSVASDIRMIGDISSEAADCISACVNCLTPTKDLDTRLEEVEAVMQGIARLVANVRAHVGNAGVNRIAKFSGER